jgi:hypothetical protein
VPSKRLCIFLSLVLAAPVLAARVFAAPNDTPGFEEVRRYYGIFKTSTLGFTQVDVRFL